jgi:hypothetical protein
VYAIPVLDPILLIVVMYVLLVDADDDVVAVDGNAEYDDSGGWDEDAIDGDCADGNDGVVEPLDSDGSCIPLPIPMLLLLPLLCFVISTACIDVAPSCSTCAFTDDTDILLSEEADDVDGYHCNVYVLPCVAVADDIGRGFCCCCVH